MPPHDALPLAASASNLLAAREQMAFTLGFHIVLSCLGVALPATILVANYLGLKRGDERRDRAGAALVEGDGGHLRRRRRHRHRADLRVRPALAALHGPLRRRLRDRLRDRGDLLLPRGDLPGDLHLRLEAALRLGPLLVRGADVRHRHRRRLRRRRRQLLDEPAAGLHPRRRRQGGRHRTAQGPDQPGDRLRGAAHDPRRLHGRRLPGRLDLRGRDAEGPARPPAPAGPADPADDRPASPPRSSSSSATPRRARSPTTSRPSSPAWSASRKPAATRPSTWAASAPPTGSRRRSRSPTSTPSWSASAPTPRSPGSNNIPKDERPPDNTLLHLAFDAMVGIGTALLALGAWLAFVWWKRRDIPRTPWFLRAVAISGAGAVLALWCGWIVTEVGRQPWIVQGYMRTSEAVTDAKGIWFSFACVLLLYAAIGTIAILVLRGMSRRWREGAAEPEGTPYAPAGGGGVAVSRADARRGDPLGRGDLLRALRRGRLRRRLLGPDRRRRREGGAAAGADPALADPGLGGQPRLADLHPRRPLDRLPARLQRGDDDALRAARPGRGRDRPARLRLRLPQVDRGPARAAGGRARPSPSPPSSPRSSWARWSARSPPATSPPPATATPSRAGWSRCRC